MGASLRSRGWLPVNIPTQRQTEIRTIAETSTKKRPATAASTRRLNWVRKRVCVLTTEVVP